MYNIPTYDHSKPEVRNDSGPSFFHRAAQISIWAPILAALFAKGIDNAVSGEHGAWVAILSLASAALVVFAFVASIVLGIIALCGMGKHGTDGILVKSICGIILSIGLLAIFGASLIHGFEQGLKRSRENRAAYEQLAQASREVEAQQKREFERNHTISVESAQPKFDKLKDALDEAAASSSPDMALAAKATKSFVDKLQAASSDYGAALKALLGPPSVLDVSNVQNRQQLQAKRKLVDDFMAENTKLLNFITKSETIYGAELTRFQVPTATAESALGGFHGKAVIRTPIEVNLRKLDQQLGTTLLAMLDLIDTNWGSWTYDEIKKKPIFTSDEVRLKYDNYLKDIRTIAAEQRKLQAQFVNLPSLATNP